MTDSPTRNLVHQRASASVPIFVATCISAVRRDRARHAPSRAVVIGAAKSAGEIVGSPNVLLPNVSRWTRRGGAPLDHNEWRTRSTLTPVRALTALAQLAACDAAAEAAA